MTASSSPRLVLHPSLSRLSLLLALLAPLSPRIAYAQSQATPPTEEQVDAARTLYREARELHKQGHVREALAKALEAFHTAPTPVTAFETGELLVEAGRLVEARDMLRAIPLMPVSPRESDKGRDARQLAASLAAQLDMRIPKIAFAERPAGVELVLDGRPVASTDATAWQGVDPGPHALLVRVDDRACTTINLSLSEGEERTIDLHDAAAACRPTAAPPLPAPPRAPSRASAPPAPSPEPSPAGERGGSLRWLGLVVAGAGVVAVGVGGGLALAAKGSYDSVAADCPARGCTQHGFDVRSDARSRADVATVLMVAGAAVAVGGGLFEWLAPPGPASTRAILGPGSVAVVGTF